MQQMLSACKAQAIIFTPDSVKAPAPDFIKVSSTLIKPTYYLRRHQAHPLLQSHALSLYDARRADILSQARNDTNSPDSPCQGKPQV